MAVWPVSFVAAQIDESPLAVEPVVAFEKLKWTGWESDNNGVPTPLRPILITNAGDGSKRLFVPQQQGIIHVFTPDAQETTVFLDINKKVQYIDKENEEGFLGMAFHPKYKMNGEFFVFYVASNQAHTTVVSRFKVSKDDPNKADPASEEELLRVPHPYWNHKGGTICFGADGFLYIASGDSGGGCDPSNVAQNANERRGGLGYGNVPITPTVLLDGVTTFYPSGQKRQFSDVGIPYAGNVQDRLRYKFDTVTTITPPAGIEEVAAFQVPLITFGYWEFKGAYKDAF